MRGTTRLKRAFPPIAYAFALSVLLHMLVPLWIRAPIAPEQVRISVNLLPMPPLPLPLQEDVPPKPLEEVLAAAPPTARDAKRAPKPAVLDVTSFDLAEPTPVSAAPKSAGSEAAEPKPAETKAAEANAAEAKATNTKPGETKTTGPIAAEAKATESNPTGLESAVESEVLESTVLVPASTKASDSVTAFVGPTISDSKQTNSTETVSSHPVLEPWDAAETKRETAPERAQKRPLELEEMQDESHRKGALPDRLAAVQRQSGDISPAADGEKSVPNGASAPSLGGENLGNPEAVYDCGPTGPVRRYRVREQRPLTDWVTVLPSALMHFQTRPPLGAYLNLVDQVWVHRDRGEKRTSPIEFALPPQVLLVDLARPADAQIALGLTSGRCVVGLRYTQELLPFTLWRVPARFTGPQFPTTSSLVTITLHKDGSFELEHVAGERLPFTSGFLKNHNEIENNISRHYATGRMLEDIVIWISGNAEKATAEKRRQKHNEALRKRRPAR